MTDSITAGDGDHSEPDKRPLRQRVTDRWNGLNVAGKAVVVGGVVMAVVGGLVLLADARASTDDPAQGDDQDIGNETTSPQDYRYWTNHAGGYYVCRHQGCSKKARPTVTSHDCCGRCWTGRDCLAAALEAGQRNYTGPGGFVHTYREGILAPGICTACGEPAEAH